MKPQDSIPNQIYAQLGGATLYMLGFGGNVCAHHARGIRFEVKGSPKRVNRIEIVLAADDTYSIRFLRETRALRRVFQVDSIADVDGIYADQLHEVIERYTGLATRMPRVIFGGER